MSLHKFADMVASKGRGDDSLLIHMTPDEVQRLQSFAEANGRSLTINPDTGLPEAGMLSDLFKAVAPIALGAFLGPAGAAIGGGFMSAGMAGLTVGGLTTLATGSLSRGLMAGMGAYGGAGLGESLMNAGTGGLAATDIAAQQLTGSFPTLAEGATQEQIAKYATDVGALRDAAVSKAGEAGLMSKASAGLGAIADNPAAYGKDLFKYGSAAAAPIMAGQMVPTTTKMPENTNPAYIRQKLYDPYTQTYKSLAPVKAADWGSRNFSDAYTNPQTGEMATLQPRAPSGMATGGIVALAAGGRGTNVATDVDATTPAPMSINDLYKQVLGRDVESEGAAGYWANQFGNTIDPNEIEAFRTAAAPELAARNVGNTGLAALNTGAAAPTGMSLSAAQADVADIYRNVLGRDVDPTGLNYWSQKFATSSDPNAVYNELLASAKTNTEMIRADAPTTFANASKDYTGYQSTDTGNIVDEWVRNNLGRDPTNADRRQQWYKDAADKMLTQDQAKTLYSQFANYVADETGKQPILNWMEASQLKALPTAPTTSTPTTVVPATTTTTTLPTNPQTNAPPNTKNPYGNKNNPGDLTFNNDGTITVTPNIPGRPYGGFSGMDEVKNAYTAGGGSLGYTSPVVKTAAEHAARYDRMTNDSAAAYDYLMGKGANPVQSQAATSSTGIMRPYFTGGARYTPRYLTANASGAVTSSTTNPNAPTSGTTPSAQSINVRTPSGTVVTAFLGSDGTYRTVDGAKYDVSGKPIVVEAEGVAAANGGMMGYSVGGGLGSLGSYSDGGRLLKGPGDGVSDSIPATIGAKQQPARLADGEFVIPARIVSELGNGSTDAGAKKLYAMMDRVQKARGKTTGKNKVAANSRAEKYLPA